MPSMALQENNYIDLQLTKHQQKKQKNIYSKVGWNQISLAGKPEKKCVY